MKVPAILTALLLFPACAHGTILLSYEFTNFNPTVTTNAALIEGSAVTAGNLGQFRIQDISETENPWAPPSLQTRGRANITTLEAAVDQNIQFSITINPHEMVNLTQLAFDTDTSPTTSIPWLAIRSSLTDDTNLLNLIVTGTRINPVSHSVDLTAHEVFATLDVPVTFYFYTYNQNGVATLTTEFDNITFSGEAVPEPATPLLLASAAAMALLKRRRK